MKRAEWIDSCRFFAIFVIMVTHFLGKVSPAALELWEIPPSSWLLYGLTGKFSVAFFFVLLGYFASKPATFSFSSISRYTVRRYLQFAFYIFVTSIVFVCGSYCVTWVFHSSDEYVMRVLSDGLKYNLIYLMRDAFLFEDNYNATLWCMQQLFLASIICRLIGYIPKKVPAALRILSVLFLISVLMFYNADFCVWICAALLGYFLRIILEICEARHILQSRLQLFFSAFAALVFIKLKMPESVVQYWLQSLAAFMLIYVQFNLPAVQRLLSKAPFPQLGGISIGLFVVHTPVNSLLYSSLYCLCLKFMPKFPAVLIYFIVSLGTCIVCSWLLKMFYEFFLRLFAKTKVTV